VSGSGRDEPAAPPLERAMVQQATCVLDRRDWMSQHEMRALPEVDAILKAPEDVRRGCVLELAAATRAGHFWTFSVLSMAARRKLALSFADVRLLLQIADEHARAEHPGPWHARNFVGGVINRLEQVAENWSPSERAELDPLLEQVAGRIDDRTLAACLRALGTSSGDVDVLAFISPDDDVGYRLREVLEASTEDEAAIAEFVAVIRGLPATGKPSKRWHMEAAGARARLADPDALVRALLDALAAAADTPRGAPSNMVSYLDLDNEPLAVAILRFAGDGSDPQLLFRLRSLALHCVTVIGGQFGWPRSLKVANAAAEAIAEVGLSGSITELLALERAVRHGSLRKQIRRAIDRLAKAQGVTRDELLERAVERHGLGVAGSRDVGLSKGAARLRIDGLAAALIFVDESGTPRKSFPKSVKQADGDALTGLRAQLKALRVTIAGERHRLDALLAADRRWNLDEWRALYLEHPVTGALARRLIWTFLGPDGERVTGLPSAAGVTVSSGVRVDVPVGAQVALWHPVHQTTEDVRAWRQHLLDEQLVQPVKQAFRETYVLTPAELETGTYSNRFAGHVFGQVQARALMKGRDWKPVPLAWWDDGIDHGVARRTYEPFGIRAEFFFDAILDMHPTSGDMYPYCTSDQVRFYEGDEQLELRDVPLVVLTEAMRDVDLFIGVTSIGADPHWLDRGDAPRFESYWHSISFGDLTEAAKVRHEVLANLLPRLAIADRCDLGERFLEVRGDVRSYRIHLGSANILMAPNDQYLCIVAARDRRADKLFLPFDDDPVLSLILSKAFLLADDTAITDPTIVTQIRR
jgi:tetrahydromethanopterin S-methyltransferase subunit F